MREYIPTVQYTITHRKHKITEHYLDGHDNIKHIAQRISERIPNEQYQLLRHIRLKTTSQVNMTI